MLWAWRTCDCLQAAAVGERGGAAAAADGSLPLSVHCRI